MAMTACKECGKQVSTEARACPHCGAAAPAKKKARGGIGKWLLIVFAIGLVATILPKKDKVAASSAPPRVQAQAAPRAAIKAEKVLPPECKIAKKDGTLDARECDLEELCKDWLFYRRKIVEYSNDGKEEKAADARRWFKRVNVSLTEYDEKDVNACLTRHGG